MKVVELADHAFGEPKAEHCVVIEPTIAETVAHLSKNIIEVPISREHSLTALFRPIGREHRLADTKSRPGKASQ
jgi:hypothetical protein